MDIKTRKMTRDQIAEMLGNNPRAIRAWEALISDVADTLPSAFDFSWQAAPSGVPSDVMSLVSELRQDLDAAQSVNAELRAAVQSLTERVNTIEQAPSL